MQYDIVDSLILKYENKIMFIWNYMSDSIDDELEEYFWINTIF